MLQLVYIKQAMQRTSYKKFHQARNEITLILHGSINQMRTVCVILGMFPLLELLMTQQMKHRKIFYKTLKETKNSKFEKSSAS